MRLRYVWYIFNLSLLWSVENRVYYNSTFSLNLLNLFNLIHGGATQILIYLLMCLYVLKLFVYFFKLNQVGDCLPPFPLSINRVSCFQVFVIYSCQRNNDFVLITQFVDPLWFCLGVFLISLVCKTIQGSQRLKDSIRKEIANINTR